jgi:hypothetical protein
MPYFLVEGCQRQPNIGLALMIFNGTPDTRFLTVVEEENPQSAINLIFDEYNTDYERCQALSERFDKGELSENEADEFLSAARPIGKKQWKTKEITKEKFVTLRAMIYRGRTHSEIKQRAEAKS